MQINKRFLKFVNIQILNIAASIILGKYIAVNFDPNYFGEYSLITGLLSLVSLFFLTPTIQSFRTCYFKKNNFDIQGTYLAIISAFLLFICIISPIFLVFTDKLYLILLSVAIFCIQSYYAFFSAEINLQGRNNLYSYIQVSIPICTILSLIILNYFKISKIETLLIATIFGNFIALAFSCYFAKVKSLKISIINALKSEEFQSLIKYIKPILFLPLFSWIVSSGDKYIINFFLNEHAVGVYSASYSIGSKIFLSMSGLLILWLNSSVFSKVNETSKLTDEFLNLTLNRMKLYILFGLIIVGFVQIFSNKIGSILLSPNYSEGFYLMGILSLSQLIFTSFQFLEQIVYAEGSTKLIIQHYMFGAVINLVLNLVLIPLIGVLGSAVAMLLSTTAQLFFLKMLIQNQIKTS